MEENLRQEPSNCIKIVLFGPESTGKTTLSKELANHYKTRWTPEYAREYLQNKWETQKESCTYDDLIPIAIGQIKLENEATKKANKILFCDTDLLETKVYSQVYFEEKVPENLEIFSLKNKYDLYLLTYIDAPWVSDDLRDKPQEREQMFMRFHEALKKYDRPFVLVKGSIKKRLQIVIPIIDQLIQQKSEYYRKR